MTKTISGNLKKHLQWIAWIQASQKNDISSTRCTIVCDLRVIGKKLRESPKRILKVWLSEIPIGGLNRE